MKYDSWGWINEARIHRTSAQLLNPATYEPAYSPTAIVTLAKYDSYLHIVGRVIPTEYEGAVVKGDKMFIDIMLTDGPDWMTSNPIKWAEVYLRVYNPDGTLHFEDWDLTSEYGSVSFVNVPLPTMTGTCTVVASFAGNGTYNPSEASINFVIEARTPILSLTMPPSAFPGDTVAWSGGMFDPKIPTLPLTNRPVYLEESIDEVTWTQVAGPVSTNENGAYSSSYRLPTTPGTYYYRTYYPGGAGSQMYERRTSPTVMVKVTEEAPPPPIPVWKLALIALSIVSAVAGTICVVKKK